MLPATEDIPLAQYQAAVQAVRERTRYTPRIGLILGSGLGAVAEAMQAVDDIPGSQIPGWPPCAVEGHLGRVLIGQLEGHPVIIQQGRTHYYEGYSLQRITLPVRVMQMLGVRILIVTNAAGAINPAYRTGDLMLLTDHINLMGMVGLSPLRGHNLDVFGPRFPDMSCAYDPQLRALAEAEAEANAIPLHQGVYICLAGPAFETPADLRFLRVIGADAVGMSTVPEVTVARHGGLRVLGVSGISNSAKGAGQTALTHAEVLEAGQLLAPRLTALVRGVLRRLTPNAIG